MSILKRSAAAIKEKKSLAVAYLSNRRSHGDLDFEAAVIKATNHDECNVGKRNARLVFCWIRASPDNLYPFVRALSKRMEKTRSWVVAIKGLMLMHDLGHCKLLDVKKMGRLPFDLSSFTDGHSRLSKTWGFNAFIRQYFAFLDQRGVIWRDEENNTGNDSPLMVRQLSKLRKWQLLLGMLLEIRPRADNMKVPLILEAMDYVVIEIFDVHSRICSEISQVLLEVHSVEGKLEASMALEILRMATTQDEELSRYLEFCKEYGVLKANEFIAVAGIPEEDVEKLERIIHGASDKTYKDQMALVVREENNAIVEHGETMEIFKTRITEKWEVFHENNTAADQESGTRKDSDQPHNPFEIPDFISFLD